MALGKDSRNPSVMESPPMDLRQPNQVLEAAQELRYNIRSGQVPSRAPKLTTSLPTRHTRVNLTSGLTNSLQNGRRKNDLHAHLCILPRGRFGNRLRCLHGRQNLSP